MKKKRFDCVAMKHEIQQRIAEETRAMTDEEKRRWTRQKIAGDPILGPYWAKLRKVRGSGLIAKESGSVYVGDRPDLAASE